MTSPSSASFHAVRFGRSAARYEAHAGVQARMADALLSLWGERSAPARILEFGCGTGLLTRRVRARFPQASLIATDASPEMLDLARRAVEADAPPDGTSDELGAGASPAVAFTTLDARGTLDSVASLLALASSLGSTLPADLVVSGALVQWFPDLAAHLRFAGARATPGAVYLVSGFDRDNFPELNALLSESPFFYRNFPGHTHQGVIAAAGESGWQVSGYLSWDETEVLPSARAVLQRMQDLGSVRDPREGGRMTRGNLAHLLDAYERRFRVEEPGGGVRLTWKPWAALLTRG